MGEAGLRWPPVTAALEVVFWTAVGLLVYAQVGYGLLLAALAAVRRGGTVPVAPTTPDVSLIVAAHREEDVIADKVADALALDYPRERLEVVVACDGCDDATAERARAAGADQVLELPRAGKTRTQDEAVRRARGDVLAFSDANARWDPGALRELVAPLADPGVGYVCGRVEFDDTAGRNQEGLYWRYETVLRGLESRLASVTAGNGAIYAVWREDYVELDPASSHDLALPFTLVKRRRRAVFAPAARARERALPTIGGEFARKRRMMRRGWPIVLRSGMLSPRGYGPLYALMIGSHRVLRYGTPFLHVLALGLNVALVGEAWVYAATLALQAAVLAAALLAGALPFRPFLVARYYVATQASVVAGLWDWLRRGPLPAWAPAEGTR
jgi:cellulose synthase/poly-beta-1,6-N-acetylglucosamine synthase-like glycosyltransferase